MQYQISTLPNNLRVVTAEMPGAYSATVSVAIGVGSRHENYAVNGGVSHFLEHLLFKGTKNRPSTKIISEQIDAVGGWNNAYTSNELTNYFVKVPYQHVALGIDILADMIRNSLFDPQEIDRERNVVIEEMNVYRDDPASYVHRLTPELLWPGHPLSHEVIGSEEVIRRIKRDAIVDYQNSFYKPGNMVVAVAGRVKHQDIVKQVEKLMGDMGDSPIAKSPKVIKELSDQKVATLQKDTAQTHLSISTVAYPYAHPDDPAAKVIATILGRGLSSRLFMNVRERKGLAYSVSAGIENYVDSGEFEVYAGVNNAKAAEAIKAIIDELTLLADEPVGADELNKAKNQLRGSLEMAMESNSNVADRAAGQLLLLNELKSVEDTLAEIDAVTAADITRVASELLKPSRLRMGIISSDPDPAAEAFTRLTT